MQIIEANYNAVIGWAHPIRAAIHGNRILRPRDKAWRRGPLSDLAFAIETRLTYLPRILNFIDENTRALVKEMVEAEVDHFVTDAVFDFQDHRAADHVLFGTTAFITESRACFENLAAFYRLFLQTYCRRSITKPQSYNVVARATRPYAWSGALHRIRGDLMHARSLFLAFRLDPQGPTSFTPLFSMNWRPGRFGREHRIEFETLVSIRDGLYQAAAAMKAKMSGIAAARRR